MTDQQQPITPPPELVEKWANDSVPRRADAIGRDWEIAFATRAAAWGANQELEACCECLESYGWHTAAQDIRAKRLTGAPRTPRGSASQPCSTSCQPKMTDFRVLCAELADNLERYQSWYIEDNGYGLDNLEALLRRAAAALAQPEPQGPTDEELLELMPESMRDEFSYAARVCSDATGGQVKPGIFRVALNTAALEYAQAVLAKYGN